MALGSQYAFWPEWMPHVQESGFSMQPEDVRQTTETEIGAIIRPQFMSDVLIASCTLVLSRIQGAWFEFFEKAMTQEGLWFAFPLWYAGEIRYGKCQFKERPKWSVEALTTTYSFSLLVNRRSLAIDACLLDLLDCWTPKEAALILHEIDLAIKALDESTVVPELEDLCEWCNAEVLNCWSLSEMEQICASAEAARREANLSTIFTGV